jgi:polyhydroxyalkanoate synthesis regulator phasin
LDELARRGREARDELARRGLGARDELANRIEALERRLSALEDALRTKPKPKAED